MRPAQRRGAWPGKERIECSLGAEEDGATDVSPEQKGWVTTA
jgi:hypothetical protein